MQRLSAHTFFLLYLFINATALSGSTLVLFDLITNSTALALLFAGIVVATGISPTILIGLSFFSLAAGGNRPSSEQAYITMLVGCALYIGLLIRSWRDKKCTLPRTQPVLIATLLYVAFSVLSLVTLPWPFVLEALNTAGLHQFFRITEHHLAYPLLSVFLTCVAAALGLQVYSIAIESSEKRVFFASAVCAGLLGSIVIGLADYYHFLDLSWYRPLDPVVNPGGVQFRLQSLFAHSGWYAEYLTLAIPFLLILLVLPWPFWLRAALILLCMLIGEFALILTYQRGGWLSYPFTLCAVWAAIYVCHCREHGQTALLPALKKSIGKIAISLPLTVVLSLLLVSVLRKEYVNPEVMSSYIDRFKAIGQTSDRTDFFVAGTLIGLRHPLLGAGSESFATEFEREFESPTGTHFNRFSLPLHGSAHNVYAQTFAGKGLAGLLALLAIPLCLLRALRHVKAMPTEPLERQLMLLIGSCFAVAFLIYGNVQEIFYIQALQFLFFAVIGLCAAVLPDSNCVRTTWIAPCLLLVLLTHLCWEFLWPGNGIQRWQDRPAVSCFAEEPHPELGTFRWCGPESFIVFSNQDLAEKTLQVVTTADVSTGSFELKYSVNNESWQTIEVAGSPVALPAIQPPAETDITLRFHSERYFVPAQRFSHNQDQRKLSFQLILK